MAWSKARTATVAGLIILAVAGSALITSHYLTRKHRKMPVTFARQLEEIEKTPGFALSHEAIDYLHQLRINGQLPGVGTNEQIEVLFPSRLTKAENYPVKRELQARKRNVAGSFSYHYLLVKASETSGWRLQSAWHVGMNGAVEELSIP